jgi:H+-translocating NAD(P) transhydrogenase subunit beta
VTSFINMIPDFGIILVLLGGIYLFNSPVTAKFGNLLAATAMLLGIGLTIWRNELAYPWLLVLGTGAGAIVGWRLAMWVNMVQIPAMVAFQHGAGGLAAALIAYLELVGGGTLELANEIAGVLGLLLGAATFSGSLIASGKLSGRLRSAPQNLPQHGKLLLLVVAASALLGGVALTVPGTSKALLLIVTSLVAVGLGVLFSVRIGGADMPVLISFLNASAGLAAAACGIVLGDRLLITFGATVTASGWILTHVMCKAMNRSLFKVFAGLQQPARSKHFEIFAADPVAPPAPAAPQRKPVDSLIAAIEMARQAQSVVIIPGYGMALARAQFKVVELANQLKAYGKTVKFAIHPVAGRMPGHMHVLLAEADIDYSLLFEMDDINDEFKHTDLALVVGACDVVNPAAIQIDGTPLSGMPILMAKDARNVVVCNLDCKPGYSGVDNLLYDDPRTILLMGDAGKTVTGLLEGLRNGESAEVAGTSGAPD